MKITEMALDNRPRERLEKYGPHALSSAELLAIILKSGTQKENVLEICNKLIAKYSLEKLSSCTLTELVQAHGIGMAKASQIVALFELYRRVEHSTKNGTRISCAKDIADKYLPKFRDVAKEHFMALFLDTRNKIIAEKTITIGTLNSSLIHPREVFYEAIKHLANAVIVIHNHPSGDPAPSQEDLEVTAILEEAGEVMGIKLLDHVILGHTEWWSWRESGK